MRLGEAAGFAPHYSNDYVRSKWSKCFGGNGKAIGIQSVTLVTRAPEMKKCQK